MIACINIDSMAETRGLALIKLAEEYLKSGAENAVNISGKLRKSILAEISRAKDEGGPEAVGALLPGILEAAKTEVARVVHFDISLSLRALLCEVVAERAALRAAALLESPRTPRKARSTRELMVRPSQEERQRKRMRKRRKNKKE